MEVMIITASITFKVLSFDPSFKQKRFKKWHSGFTHTWNARILIWRMATIVNHTLSGHLNAFKKSFLQSMNENLNNNGEYCDVLAPLFPNTDGVTVFSDVRALSSIYHIGARIVPIRASGNSIEWLIACVGVACVETKLHLFLIIESKPNRITQIGLNSPLPNNNSGCWKKKGWMNGKLCLPEQKTFGNRTLLDIASQFFCCLLLSFTSPLPL